VISLNQDVANRPLSHGTSPACQSPPRRARMRRASQHAFKRVGRGLGLVALGVLGFTAERKDRCNVDVCAAA